jgi:hypothetical protein
MSNTWVDGIGLVFVDSSKSKVDQDATLQYFIDTAPIYEDINALGIGFGDAKSIIYRQWQDRNVPSEQLTRLLKEHKITQDQYEEALRTGQLDKQFPKFRKGLEFLQPPEQPPIQLDMAEQEAHKARWKEEQMAEWGQYVGWYDSVALERYYDTLDKAGELSEVDKADRIANSTMLDAIEVDMTEAYENIWLGKGGGWDVSDVQKKYGFEEEDLTTLQSLKQAWDFAKENPLYMIGHLGGILAKDPEMLAISYFRIPAIVGRSMQGAQNLARAALQIQPKFYKTWKEMSYTQKAGYAAAGRGVEGAVYGGVYEGMRDLTFNGKIDAKNVKVGAAMGALFGTAFGGLTGHLGREFGSNWMLNKASSVKAESQLARLKASLGVFEFKRFRNADGTYTKAIGWDGTGTAKARINKKKTKKEIDEIDDIITQAEKNPNFRNLENIEQPSKGGTVEIVLPEGLNHIDRGTLWRNEAIRTIDERINAGKKGDDVVPLDEIAKQVDDSIAGRLKSLSLEKAKEGGNKYTNREAQGIAAKQEAKYQESKLDDGTGSYDAYLKQSGQTSVYNKNWGRQREVTRRDDLRKTTDERLEGQAVREPESFDSIVKDVKAETRGRPPNAKLFKAAVIGAAGGALLINDDGDNYAFGALLGMATGFAFRFGVRGINRNAAIMRKRVFNAADDAEEITMGLRHQVRATMDLMGNILKGKHARLQSLEFVNYVENWTLPKKGHPQYAKKLKLIQERKALVKKFPEVGEAMDAFRNTMAIFKDMATKAGVLLDEQQILDYVTHIMKRQVWSSPEMVFKIAEATGLKNKSPFGDMRGHQATIAQLKKAGYAIEDDIFVILDAYTRSMTKAITGRMIIDGVQNAKIVHGKFDVGLIIGRGEKIAAMAKKELHYVTSNHPALEGKLIHPVVAKAIDQFFTINKGGMGIMDKILLVNNTLKRANIMMSFFHAQALIASGIYSGAYIHVMTPAGRVKMKKIREMLNAEWSPTAVLTDAHGNPVYQRGSNGVLIKGADGKPIKMLGDYKHKDLMNDIAKSKMSIGQARNNEALLPGYRGMKRILEKYPLLKPIDKIQSGIDKATWDMLHDYSKIFTYMMMKERLMSADARGVARFKFVGEWKGMSDANATKLAGTFADDAFGGQNMTKLANEFQAMAIREADNPKGMLAHVAAAALTPSKIKYGNLFAFSPDWTLSNFRIAFRGIGMSTKGLNKVVKGQKLTPKEMAELNLYLGYTVRGILATSFFAYMIHKIWAEADDKFDLKEFWLTGRLGMGGGEEWVISKQIAEPMHWLQNPFHTGLSKASIVPKTIFELILGKEYLSVKSGTLRAPILDKNDPVDLAFWAAQKPFPISGSPLSSFIRELVDPDFKGEKSFRETMRKMLHSAGGFPIYPHKERLDVTK